MSNFISLAKAKAMVATYRKMKDVVLKNEYINVLPVAETFDRAQFDKLLSKDGCTGLRIYYGMSEDLKLHAIIVGVNERNEDLITGASITTTDTNTTTSSDTGDDNDDEDDDEIIEDAIPCPPYCPPPSGLYP